MFHRGRNVSISLPTFLLSPFLAPLHLLRENDLPFCLLIIKYWLMFTDEQSAIKSPCLCRGDPLLHSLLLLRGLDLPEAPGGESLAIFLYLGKASLL